MLTGEPLVDLTKLRLAAGRIYYFVYQQDNTRQEMSCRDTTSNRLFVAWLQIHDSPWTDKVNPAHGYDPVAQ